MCFPDKILRLAFKIALPPRRRVFPKNLHKWFFCLFKFLRFPGLRMSKRLSFYGLVVLASVCIFFLAFNQRYSSYLEHRLQPVISVSKNSEVGIALNWVTPNTLFLTVKSNFWHLTFFIHLLTWSEDARRTDTRLLPVFFSLCLPPPFLFSFHTSFHYRNVRGTTAS